MRTKRRRRHHLSSVALAPLRVAFRYSASREAYVLRGVGDRYGPVLKRKD
jgi:hypothetical protein